MKILLSGVAFVFVQAAGAAGEEPVDPMARLNRVVADLKAQQRQCETRLLPVPVEGNVQTAAGRINRAISTLDVGETLLLNDQEMLTGRQEQWLSLLHTIGLRVLGMRPVDGFARMQVLVQRAEPAEGVLTRIVNTVPAQPGKFSVQYFKSRRSRKVFEMLNVEPGVFAFPYYVEGDRLNVLLRPQAAGIPIVQRLNEVAGTSYLPQPIHMTLAENEDPSRKVVNLLKTVMPNYLAYRVRKTENLFFQFS